jgi:hypothetical protein
MSALGIEGRTVYLNSGRTWTYNLGGGDWIQVGGMADWNFT